MAPKKFGIFKGRSREQQEQPSTENLLQSSCTDLVVYHPPSPIPSTSRGYSNDNGFSEFAIMHPDSDDEDFQDESEVNMPRRITSAKAEDAKYVTLPSTSGTSTTILAAQDLDLQDLDNDLDFQCQLEQLHKFELATPDDATSIDANSLQLDTTSMVSEDVRYCGAKKPKKRQKPRLHQELSDQEMWNVDDSVVTHRLLERNCSINELLKWEAIAMLRGICTLTTNCTCRDCKAHQILNQASQTDGDAGMASAPFISAISIGCQLQ